LGIPGKITSLGRIGMLMVDEFDLAPTSLCNILIPFEIEGHSLINGCLWWAAKTLSGFLPTVEEIRFALKLQVNK
jgi:hypothetical protein